MLVPSRDKPARLRLCANSVEILRRQYCRGQPAGWLVASLRLEGQWNILASDNIYFQLKISHRHLFGPSIRYLYFLSAKCPKMGRFHQNHHFDQYHHQDISLGRIEIAVSKNLLKIYERVKFTFGHLNKFLLRRSFLIKILRSKAVPRDQRFPTPKVDWVGLSWVGYIWICKRALLRSANHVP